MSEPESVWPTAALMTLVVLLMSITFHTCAMTGPDPATSRTPTERTTP